jgi:hypothetical protein
MEPQRRQKRQPTLAAAHLILGKSERVDCYIRDSSEHGARLRLMDERLRLPRGFQIRMPGGKVEEAELVWQNGSSAGIRFLARW